MAETEGGSLSARLSTTDIGLISTPVEGLQAFDITTKQQKIYTGTSFQAQNPGTASKFVRFPFTWDQFLDTFRIRRLATSGSTNDNLFIPEDFSSLNNCFFYFIPSAGAAGASKSITLTVKYGKLGETFNGTTETSTFNVNMGTANQVSRYDISSVMTTIEAGDIVGFSLNQNAVGGNVDYTFMELDYVAA